MKLLRHAMRIMADAERPVAELLQDVVDLLPVARISVGELQAATPNFTNGPATQSAAFVTSDGRVGRVEVKGPLRTEERELMEALAEVVAAALDRRLAWDLLHRLNADLEQRVAERSVALQAKSRALETFSYSVAHDLKTPLRAIHGYAALLIEEKGDHLDEDARAYLCHIDRAALQMERLIEDLLTYSRLERRESASRRVDLRALVDSLLAPRRAELAARGVKVVTSLVCDSVEVDTRGLAQALRNYIDNAIKFTRDVPEPRIDIGCESNGDSCRLWVRDNGTGFDMQYHDRIFEIFQRLQRSDDEPGTGVGLAIARKAAERWGGRAWAVSAVGQGATFYLEIPKRGLT